MDATGYAVEAFNMVNKKRDEVGQLQNSLTLFQKTLQYALDNGLITELESYEVARLVLTSKFS